MCENSGSVWYGEVAEVKRQIDEKIGHLKEKLELRRVALNGKVDRFILGGEIDLNIRFDWSDSEIEEKIGFLGSVELETTQNRTPLSSDTDILSSDKDILSSNTDILSSDKDILSSNTDILSSDKDILSSDTDILSSNTDILSSDKDILSSDTDILSSDTDILSSDKKEEGIACSLYCEKEYEESLDGIDSDIYMTMKRQKRNAAETTENRTKQNIIATIKIPTNFGTDGEDINGLLSPVLKNVPLEEPYTYMNPIKNKPQVKRSTSLSSFEQLRAMFEPDTKLHKPNKKRQSEILESLFDSQQTEEGLYSGFEATDENKLSPAKWKSEELLTDPVYEVIDEKFLKNITGTLGSKRTRFLKKASERTFDLPVIARCTQGKRLGQLDKPKSVTVSPRGLIYVAEKGNNRIQVFNSEAYHLFSFGEKTGSNRMVGPYGLFVRSDYVYVTLTSQHCLQMYTSEGVFVRQKGKEGKEEGRLRLPTGVDGDKERGKIYVCDTGNNRIQIFDKNLKFIKVVRITKLDKPLAIKVVGHEEFVVLDRSPVCLHVFNTSGHLLREMCDTRYHLKLVNPLYFTISPQGHILISDFSNHCIHVFSEDGTLSWILGEAGKGKPLEEPRGIACDTNGRLITVCNKKQDSLQIFVI